MSKTKSRKVLKKPVIISLEESYGITYDDIKPDPEPVKDEPDISEPEVEAITETEKKTIADIIESAVYSGMMKALSDVSAQTQLANFLTKVNADGWKMAWRERLEQQAEDRRVNRNKS